MNLSDRQRAAVEAAPGGLFVAAAAGSGKTRVLTARFARLVGEARDAGAEEPLDALIAITFTDKAAGELSQRIRGTLTEQVGIDLARRTERAWISTIHGLCRRLLKRHAFEAGLDPAFGVCDEVQAGILRRESFVRAVAALSDVRAVERLLDDYELETLEEDVRRVDGRIRSLGLCCGDVEIVSADAGPQIAAARQDLRTILDEMRAMPDRKKTEEKNIDALARLVGTLDALDPEDPGAATALLEGARGFKQDCGCRDCAKPLAFAAKERAGEVLQTAAARACEPYLEGFIALLERYADEYAVLKREKNLLDFEDLQLKARDLLHARPDLAGRYRDRLAELMVDEFQDTNELQLSVVSALGGDTLATVGDEKQSIYGFRDADVGVFRRRRGAVDESRLYPLPENYRSDKDLVGFYNALFSADPFWPDDFMLLEPLKEEKPSGDDGARAWPEGEPRVRLTLLNEDECGDIGKARAEAEEVAAWFVALRDAGIRQQDLVLLLRAMTHVEIFESVLGAAGFDVYVASGGTFFEKREVEELSALLRVVSNTRDDAAFARVLAGRLANLSDDALLLIRETARHGAPGTKRSLWEAAWANDRPTLAAEDEAALLRVVSVVADLRREQGRTPLYELIHTACERLGYDLALHAAGDERAWANALKFARMALEFERSAPGDPAAFLGYLEQRKEYQSYEQQAAMAAEGIDAVRIMTVHAAKGLEFPVVAVAELEKRPPADKSMFRCGNPQGRLTLAAKLPRDERYLACGTPPARATLDEWYEERQLDEEKRVLYVACTRATEALGLFGALKPGKEPSADAAVGWLWRAMGLADVCDFPEPSATDASERAHLRERMRCRLRRDGSPSSVRDPRARVPGRDGVRGRCLKRTLWLRTSLLPSRRAWSNRLRCRRSRPRRRGPRGSRSPVCRATWNVGTATTRSTWPGWAASTSWAKTRRWRSARRCTRRCCLRTPRAACQRSGSASSRQEPGSMTRRSRASAQRSTAS